MTTSQQHLTLEILPVDILLYILNYLTLSSISSLAQTCRTLQSFVEESGWRAYATANPVPSQSLTPALKSSRWTLGDYLRNLTLAEKAWRARKYIVRPLGPEWSTKLQPQISISPSRLIVAAGNTLFAYKFAPPTRQHYEAPRIIFEQALTFPKDARKDFTGVTFDPSDSEDRTLVLSFANGALGRVEIPRSADHVRRRRGNFHVPALTLIRDHGQPIRSMSTDKNTVLTLDSMGFASLYSLSDSKPAPLSTVSVGASAAGWSTHLNIQSSSGYAVLGTASSTPLVVHSISESGFHETPQAILSPASQGGYSPAKSAVYSICGATQTFPRSSPSDQIVISGWYHGVITIHDLRCRTNCGSMGEAPMLAPAMTLRDPMTLSPIYSLSSVGAHVAGGSAHHSLLHLYDVRSPRSGWSIYLPQPQRGHSISSPVYSCVLEGTRLWAATESRAFVVDFGQGVLERTYPAFNERSPSGGLGWPVTFYEHDMFMEKTRWRARGSN